MLENAWRWFPHTYATKTSNKKWKPYKHLKYISDIITPKIISGGGRFIVNLPPRHGKSEFLSKQIPAWYLDTFKDKRVLLATYSEGLSAQFGRWVRNHFEQNQHVITSLRPDSNAATRFDTNKGGSMIATGVGGTLTGLGFDLLLLDDPVKNWEEASSSTMRQNIIDWFDTTFMTRAEPNATVILLMTRWHTEDLAGYLLKNQKDVWTHINLPALAELNDPLGRAQGEALCPERFDEEELLKMRDTMAPQFWQSLYQQRPSKIEGQIFKREWWKYYDIEPNFETIVQFWDTAQKPGLTNDYSVCATWGRTQNSYYLLDLFRKKLEAPDLERSCVANFNKWKPAQVVIEDKSSGSSLIQYLRRNTTIPIIPYNPHQKDKITRALSATGSVQAGKCFLPKNANWLHDFLQEHDDFPNAAHDDQVDTTSQMIEHFSSFQNYQPRITFL